MQRKHGLFINIVFNICAEAHRTLFCIHSLACSDGYHLVDIINRTAAAQVVYRTCDTLEDRSDGICISESLNQLVTDVADLKAREYENVCVTGDL